MSTVDAFVEHGLVLRDGLRIYCREYPASSGAADLAPVVCLPGLTRNCRDFEDLAPQLAETRRVFTPDLRGRGRSDRDADWRRYRMDSYVADVIALLDHFALARVIIVGTSLGGLIGLCLGAAHRARLAALVLNDIGPELDPVGLQRIGASVGVPVQVSSWEQAAERARLGHESVMPDYTPADWLRFARRIYRESRPGCIERDMDSGIARALVETPSGPQDFWREFRALGDLPMLCLRGALSDLLAAATLSRMHAQHPDLCSTVVPARGHAPTLDEPEARRAIAEFLATLS